MSTVFPISKYQNILIFLLSSKCTDQADLHYYSLLLQQQLLWQARGVQHYAMQCRMTASEKGSEKLKSFTKLQEGHQRTWNELHRALGSKEASVQGRDCGTAVLLTFPGSALTDQLGLFFLHYSIPWCAIECPLATAFVSGHKEFSLTTMYRDAENSFPFRPFTQMLLL